MASLYEFYGVVLLVYSALALVIIHYVYSRKEMQPLKIREPNLMLLSLVGGWVTAGMVCFREIAPDQFSCSVYVWVACLFPPAFFVPYYLRCIKLKFVYHWLQQRSESRESHTLSKVSGAAGQSWYLKKGKWFSQGTLLVIFFLVFGVHILLGFMVDMSIETTVVGADHHQEDQHMIFKPVEYRHAGCIFEYEFFIFLVIAMAYVLMLALCLISLRNVPDGLGVRKEMLLCTVLWIGCLIPFFCFNLTPELFWINEIFPNANWIIIMSGGSMIISLGIPMLQTFSDASARTIVKMKASINIEVSKITDVLRNEALVEAFKNYLVTKLEYRNIDVFLFLIRVRDYKEKCREIIAEHSKQPAFNSPESLALLRKTLSDLAAGIWNQYIREFAESSLVIVKEVSVNGKTGAQTFSDVATYFKNTHTVNFGTVFDDVVSVCCHHLNDGILNDFCKSRYYVDLWEAKKISEATNHALRDQRLV